VAALDLGFSGRPPRRSAVLRGLIAVTSLAVLSAAADPPGSGDQARVTAIFSELLRLSYPHEFRPAFENTNGNFYIQESVLQGESVERWTQMLTVTGTKGLALNAQATPERFVERIARLSLALSGQLQPDAAGRCATRGPRFVRRAPRLRQRRGSRGAAQRGGIDRAFRGRRDYYTIQWAERGAPTAAPVVPLPPWLARWRRLAPIRTCPILEGEGPPYVSCSAAVSPPAAAPAPDSNHKERP
jgi:hypothetical protein